MTELAGKLVCPGDRLAAEGQYALGEGTYAMDGVIRASVLGLVGVNAAAQRAKSGEPSTTDGASFLPVVQVARTKAHAVSPKPGDVVTVRCTRLSQRTAVCEILTVGQVALRQKFTGIIKLQDVRAFETDSTVMAKCFRPGDIIRAEVVGLGDAKSFFLSTAKNTLGVVYAKSQTSGQPMTPVSWTQMRCPETGAVEDRKCAAVGRQVQAA